MTALFTDIGQGWLVEPADHGRTLALCGLALFVLAGALSLRRAGVARAWRLVLALTGIGMTTAWLADGLLTGDFLHRGFSSLGGVAGGLLALLVATRRGTPPLRTAADALAPGALLGLALARTACLLEGCDFGSPSASALSVAYPRGTAAFATFAAEGRLSRYAAATPPLFPFPLVEAIPLLAAGLTLWALRRRLPPGLTGALALALWGAARGTAELSRHGQPLGLALVAWSAGLLGLALGVHWLRTHHTTPATAHTAPDLTAPEPAS